MWGYQNWYVAQTGRPKILTFSYTPETFSIAKTFSYTHETFSIANLLPSRK